MLRYDDQTLESRVECRDAVAVRWNRWVMECRSVHDGFRRRRRMPGGYVHSRNSEGKNSRVMADGWRRGESSMVSERVEIGNE